MKRVYLADAQTKERSALRLTLVDLNLQVVAGDFQAHLPGNGALTAFHSVRQGPGSARPN